MVDKTLDFLSPPPCDLTFAGLLTFWGFIPIPHVPITGYRCESVIVQSSPKRRKVPRRKSKDGDLSIEHGHRGSHMTELARSRKWECR